jgi:hypothetical protein
MSKTRNFTILFTIGLVLALSAPAFAGTTGSVTISGVVPAATAIVVTGSTGYNNLDLSTSATNLQVASVVETNNTTNGYTVTLASQNSGALKNGTLGSVAYTAQYNGTAVTLSSSAVSVTTAPAANTVVNATKAFKVSYTGVPAANLMVGTYSDTLTFTISAN